MYVNEIVVQKSRFIAMLCPLNSIFQVDMYLKEARKSFKDATHYTYAYLFENSEKASDDGEPSATAGIPLLNLLKNNEFTNTLVIVIRYFGGTKLGAGRLLRTYVEAGASVVIKATKYQAIPSYHIEFQVPIQKYNSALHYLKTSNIEILNTVFNGLDVDILINISKGAMASFENLYNIKSKQEATLLQEIINGK